MNMQKKRNSAPPQAPATPAAAPELEVPAWVNYTPEIDYQLVTMGVDHAAQSIDLTLAEYEALKAHLAAMRGYAQKEAAASAAA
jgi:predicted DNA-binding protein (UPF0251 family)